MSGRVDLRGGPVEVGTVGTILAPIVATITGTLAVSIGTIGTILSPVAIGAVAGIGTIGSIQAGNVTGSISGGQLQYIGTIGTILGAPAAGTVMFGTVSIERFASRVVVQDNASAVIGFTSTFDMTLWNDVGVDIVAGTLSSAGSLLVALMGVDPVRGLVTSSIVSSDWLVSGQTQRISAFAVGGELLAVVSTIIGSVVGLTVTAGRKS